MSEIESIKTILKWINLHFQYEEQVRHAENSLNRKKQFLLSQFTRLQRLNSKLNSLHEENPDLITNNQQLDSRNAALALSLEYNNNLRQRLGMSTLLLFAFTFVSVAPLILILTGIIPFIASTLLFSLIATPPALLLITSLGVGIAAGIYAYKTRSNEAEIAINKQTIEDNTRQMGRNVHQLDTIQKTTIPNLETQIKREELLKDQFAAAAQKAQLLSTQALKQATDIEPVLFSNISFLCNGKTPSQLSIDLVQSPSTEGFQESPVLH